MSIGNPPSQLPASATLPASEVSSRDNAHWHQRGVIPVTVLCVAPKSAYLALEGVEVFDKQRDARTWPGGTAVIAHPPCRAWSKHCGHQAKPEAGEMELGMWCAEQVKKWGGILEQPAGSKLWDAARLPKPGWSHTGESWGLEVWQAWWGYPMRKATWLYFSKINPLFVCYPLRLHPPGGDRRREQLMSHKQRSETTLEFAKWLVQMCRQAGRPASEWQNGDNKD